MKIRLRVGYNESSTTADGLVNFTSRLDDQRWVCPPYRMNTPAPTDRYTHHRFPAASIRHRVWLSYRFCLRYRAEACCGPVWHDSPGIAVHCPAVQVGAKPHQ